MRNHIKGHLYKGAWGYTKNKGITFISKAQGTSGMSSSTVILGPFFNPIRKKVYPSGLPSSLITPLAGSVPVPDLYTFRSPPLLSSWPTQMPLHPSAFCTSLHFSAIARQLNCLHICYHKLPDGGGRAFYSLPPVDPQYTLIGGSNGRGKARGRGKRGGRKGERRGGLIAQAAVADTF